MDFGKAFSFAFEDPEWLRKTLISALIGIIPIIGQIYLLGWGLEVARRIATGSIEPLPDVEFGAYLGQGFKAFIVALVWTAPIWLVSIVVAIISSLIYNGNTNAGNVAATVVSVCFGLFALVVGIFVGVVLPAAFTRMVLSGSIGDGLNFGAVWGLVRAAPGPWLMALVGNIVAGILAGIIGTILCGIGIVFTTALYQVVMGHLYGQAYIASQRA